MRISHWLMHSKSRSDWLIPYYQILVIRIPSKAQPLNQKFELCSIAFWVRRRVLEPKILKLPSGGTTLKPVYEVRSIVNFMFLVNNFHKNEILLLMISLTLFRNINLGWSNSTYHVRSCFQSTLVDIHKYSRLHRLYTCHHSRMDYWSRRSKL